MNKEGWKDIIDRYRAATTLVHDREQFSSRLRQLRGQWGFCNKLRYASGLGRRPDGTIVASDEWWDENTKVIHETTSILLSIYLVHNQIKLVSFCRDIQIGGSSRMVCLNTCLKWIVCLMVLQ